MKKSDIKILCLLNVLNILDVTINLLFRIMRIKTQTVINESVLVLFLENSINLQNVILKPNDPDV